MSMVFGFAGVPVKATLPLTVPASARLGQSRRVDATKNFMGRIALTPSEFDFYLHYFRPPWGFASGWGAGGEAGGVAGVSSFGILPPAARTTSFSLLWRLICNVRR